MISRLPTFLIYGDTYRYIQYSIQSTLQWGMLAGLLPTPPSWWRSEKSPRTWTPKKIGGKHEFEQWLKMLITVAETNISDLGLSQSSEVRTSKPTKSIHPSYHVLHVVGKLLAFRPPKWLFWEWPLPGNLSGMFCPCMGHQIYRPLNQPLELRPVKVRGVSTRFPRQNPMKRKDVNWRNDVLIYITNYKHSTAIIS